MVRKRKPKAFEGYILIGDDGRAVRHPASGGGFVVDLFSARFAAELCGNIERVIRFRVVPSSPRKRKVKR